MSVPLLEDKASSQSQSSDNVQLDDSQEIKLAKLSMNMKSYCGIHLRLLHSLNGESVHSLFMMKPECQIKILEKNLNFIKKKRSRFSNLQMKGNTSNLNNSSTISLLDGNKDNNLVADYLLKEGKNPVVKTEKCGFSEEVHTKSTYSKDEVPVSLKNEEVKENMITLSPLIKPRNNKFLNMKKRKGFKNLPGTDLTLTINKSDLNDNNAKKNNIDNDNHFEFTVEQEKIVSFVCSPSPPRKQSIQSSSSCNNDDLLASNHESENHSLLSPKEDSLHETFSSLSCKKAEAVNTTRKNNDLSWQHFAKVNKILWHPPPSQKYLEPHSTDKLYTDCCSSRFVKSNSAGSMNLQPSLNAGNALITQNILKSSITHETILFREASLRGCYSLENILKEIKPQSQNIEEEVNKVRESIYSAVRLQRKNNDIVPDSIYAILDICKSWINLNAHFEREDFKEFLEMSGVDISVLSDFLHWQCVSRTFIDKMIVAMKKIATEKKAGIAVHSQLGNFANCCNDVNHSLSNNTRCLTFSSSNDGKPCCDLRDVQTSCLLPVGELAQNKNWKQRRFLSDHSKPVPSDNIAKCLFKSKLTVGSPITDEPPLSAAFNAEVFYGQGDTICHSRDVHMNKFNSSLETNSHCVPGGANIFTSGINYTQQSVMAPEPVKNSNLSSTGMKGLNEFCIVKGNTNRYPLPSINDVLCCSTPAVMDLTVNSATPVVPTIPHFYTNPFCYVNPAQTQCNLGQSLIKPNPILCLDTDIMESCIKSSYMKPGSYNPPQKPLNCQKLANNNIPIEDTPVVGVPFIYSNSQNNQQQSKGFSNSVNNSLLHLSAENTCINTSDETWKTALTLAETFRDSLMATKIDSPNLKLSDTVSLKSHFLLSDEGSQHSSNNEIKLESESEDLSQPDNSTANLETSVVETQFKTSDWLLNSFNKAISENKKTEQVNGNGFEKSTDNLSKLNPDMDTTSCQVLHGRDEQSDLATSSTSRKISNEFTFTERSTNINSLSQNILNCTQKKTKKIKKARDDCVEPFEHTSPMLHRKPKAIIKRAVTKQIACKLQDILDSIWKTEVSSLVPEDLKTEKDVSRLELKVRSPLYLQAMKCKLTNHSYDTLEQALMDFQQYFTDAKNRNKGDKQCIEVVVALEQVFFGLVEKHFGLLYQPSPQYFGNLGLAPGMKPRRTKKTPRRC